jgi:vitamin B12 transporter
MKSPRLRALPALLILILIFSIAPLARPQSPSPEKTKSPLAHEVVVTATRLETPGREVASAATILSSKDLAASNRTTVLEVLQGVPGLSIQQNGPPGAAASVFIRGANPEHTLVLVDGVEMNDPISTTGLYDLAHLRLDDVERIEIIRGPQSTLYGSEAMGGVIHIITRSGQGRPHFHLSGLAGSYGTASAGASLSGQQGRFRYFLNSSFMRTDGFSAAGASYPGNTEKDGWRSLSLAGRLGWAIGDNTELELAAGRLASRLNLDNFGGPYGDDPNFRQDYVSLQVRGSLRTLLLRNRWEQRLILSFVKHDRTYDNPTDQSHPMDSEQGSFAGQRLKMDWQNNIFLDAVNTLTAGLELERESGESEYISHSAWGEMSSPFPRRSIDSAGLYLQDQIRLGGFLFATAGGRVDRHSASGTALTWRLAPAILIPGTSTKIRTTLGTGFKAPSLYQLYAPGTVWGPIGNLTLRPERSLGWDLGLEQAFFQGKFIASAGYFHNSFRNLIQFDTIHGYANIGRAETKGVEMELAAGLWPWLNLESSYTRTEARDLDSQTELLRRPRDKFTARLRLQAGSRAVITVDLTRLGPRYDLEYIGWTTQRLRLEPFTLLGAMASLTVRKEVEIFLRLDNILDQTYELVWGYGTPRFSAYAGLRVDL